MTRGDGRPLRFLAYVGCCWTGGRFVLVLNATGSLPEAVRAVVPLPRPAIAAAALPARGLSVASPPTDRRSHPAGRRERAVSVAPPPVVRTVFLAATDVPVGAGSRSIGRDDRLLAAVTVPPPVGIAVPAQRDPLPPVAPPRGARLSVSTWLIARGGTGLGASALSPQLGGAQGGVRVDYALGHGIAATARIAAPAVGIGREVSVGVAWRPAGVPVRIVAEQRIAIDGGRGGPGLGLSTGVSSLRLPGRFSLDGYAQAGAIARAGIERYADAGVRAARPLAEVGGIAIDIGAGAWGGAQRGVARIDVGPSIGARLPLAGQVVRLALDWRQRIAGNARPGSGPALTIGGDF